jgi:hypothetical protein
VKIIQINLVLALWLKTYKRDKETDMSKKIKLFEFSKNHPLYIHHPVGGNRVIAELFKVKKGFIFFDVYWCISDAHPIHHVEAKRIDYCPHPDGRQSWNIIMPDDVAFVFELRKGDDLWNEYLGWQDFKKTTDEGKNATTERALTLLS